ncbi:MAG: hypothetical protein HOP28_07855 [Gemmatimonadales bacterium]|nr:hypothetical protein [Gemmatimonadales bacterium]
MNRETRWMAGVLLMGSLAAACENGGADLGFQPIPNGGAVVQVYLDRDGSSTRTDFDTTYAGASVSLRPYYGGASVQTKPTLVTGQALFEQVPFGDYSVSVGQASVGDSLLVAAIDASHIRIRAAVDAPSVIVRLAYPEVSIRQARQMAPGKRVLIRGIVLAGVQSYHDASSFVKDTSGTIRLTGVTIRGTQLGNTPGDSVTVLGTTTANAGQPVLNLAIISQIVQRPSPAVLPVSSANAAAATNGTLDAALVVVTGVVISEAAPAAPDFRVVASDGSGPLTIILDSATDFDLSAFTIGRTMAVRGVLVPDGTGKWRLKPRVREDVVFF